MTEKSIFESENLFKELFDNMNSGVAIYEVYNNGEDFIFKEFNIPSEKISNIKRDDVIGKKVTEVFPGVKELGLFEVFQRVWKTGKAEIHPTSMYRDERIIRWVQNYVFKLSSDNIVAIYTDVTEKRIAEEKLKHSELDLKKKNQELIELFNSSKLILRNKDFNKTAKEIFNSCKKLTGAIAGYVALLSEDGTLNDVLFLDSGGLDCTVDPNLPMPIRGLRAQAYKKRIAVYENNFFQSQWEKLMPEGHVKLENVLFVPLNLNSETKGIIGLANKMGGFSDDDVNTITPFAEIASISLLNSRTLEALEKSKNRFKNLFYNSPLGIELYDPEGKLIEANKACLDMFGVKEVSDVEGFNLFEDPNLSDDVKEKLSKGHSIQFETEFDFEKVKEFELYETSKSGRIFIDTLITPLYLKGDEHVTNYLVYVQDITNKYLTTRELNIRNQISKIFLTIIDDEMYGEVLDIILKALNSKYGVFGYIDEDGNSICPSMTRDIYDQCQMEDKTIIFPRETWSGIWATSIIEKRTINSNGPFNLPKGHIQLFNALCVPIMLQNECLGHMLVGNKERGYNNEDIELLESIADWTAPILHAKLKRKIVEEELRKLNEELEHRVRERTQKLKKSELKYRKAYYQANLYRDVFAHDLNNVLQNINSSAELSSLYLNNPEKLHTVKELNEITNEQVKRGQKLITNVRKITEIDESNTQIDKIYIGKPLEKAIEILKTSYQMRKISVQVNNIVKKKKVKANSLLLDVFENLLMNAVEHNENPKIEIFINITMERIEKGNFIKMEFKDNGIGISDYRKKSIFEKGIRKDQRSKGMGLGLSLVKKIIDSYNGKIWVENKVKGDSSKGSNFIVLIPTA